MPAPVDWPEAPPNCWVQCDRAIGIERGGKGVGDVLRRCASGPAKVPVVVPAR